jgi:hypothetical protein
MSISRGAKKLVLHGAIGSLAPLVLIGVLVQRVGRRRAVRMVGGAVTRLAPYKDRLVRERDEWRREISISEVLDWVLQDRSRGK